MPCMQMIKIRDGFTGGGWVLIFHDNAKNINEMQ